MTKGSSLKQDLRFLINNPKYSDIEIICKDEKKLHGCRAILAARSEVFDALLYNGMKESYEKQISFSKINSSGMEVILEYVYTGFVKEESLTKENIIEAFIAADYFQLPDLQDFIIKSKNNYSPELLSAIVDAIPLTEDNSLYNLLVDAVSAIPLNTIEFGRLSPKALQVLLSCTYKKEKHFVTPEYEVFRYCVILVAKQISNDATESLLKLLPTLEHMDITKKFDNELIPDRNKVAKELEPLINFIDFRRINSQIFADIIEPLNIIPVETILNVYRNKAISDNTGYNEVRGHAVSNRSDYVWDVSACGSKLIIEDNGKIVQAANGCTTQSVRAKVVFEDKGIYEWDVIIEKYCKYSWVGVCASDVINFDTATADYHFGWVLVSNGSTCHHFQTKHNYCPVFNRNNMKITVHLDMNKRTCSFTVNGVKYPPVSTWNDLPSRLYPVVSLKHPGRFRIQFH